MNCLSARPRSLLSVEDKKRDQVNELGVVLVYLRLTCTLLKIVLVKVGYNATTSAHFWPELCSNYARFCKLLAT